MDGGRRQVSAIDIPTPDVQDVTPEPARLPARTAPRLAGRQKAAILLISLGPERAAEVFRHLREEEIEALSLEMAKSARSRPTCPSTCSTSWPRSCRRTTRSRPAASSTPARCSSAVGSERAAEIVGRLSTVIERRPFEFLRRTPAEQIVTFLRDESPQTIALVVANLHTTLAAQVLSCLPEEQQADIALRIARMGETPPDVVREIENVMRRKLETVVQQDFQAAGGVKSLAEILNQTDRPTERNVLDTLGSEDGELAEEVRRRLFVFEDVARLDDRAIQMVLREVDQRDLALALRGVDEEVKERLLSNMS